MNETVEKIELFKKRDKLSSRIMEIIREKNLKKDSEIEELEEHKEFVKVTNELKSKFG